MYVIRIAFNLPEHKSKRYNDKSVNVGVIQMA